MSPKTAPPLTGEVILLYRCVQHSNKSKIDWAAVGKANDIKPGTAEMRYRRLHDKLDNPNVTTASMHSILANSGYSKIDWLAVGAALGVRPGTAEMRLRRLKIRISGTTDVDENAGLSGNGKAKKRKSTTLQEPPAAKKRSKLAGASEKQNGIKEEVASPSEVDVGAEANTASFKPALVADPKTDLGVKYNEKPQDTMLSSSPALATPLYPETPKRPSPYVDLLDRFQASSRPGKTVEPDVLFDTHLMSPNTPSRSFNSHYPEPETLVQTFGAQSMPSDPLTPSPRFTREK